MNESVQTFDQNLCPHGKVRESCEECRQERFARGEITNEEIKEYWHDPNQPLFTTSVEGRDKTVEFSVNGLTEKSWRLLKNLYSAWDLYSFIGLERTLTAYREQRKESNPPLLGVEYYTATDVKNNQPFGITGLYTYDIYGPGFSSMDRLDPEKHQLATGLGWFAVAKKYQGAGVGRFLLQWSENMARSRGAGHMFIETDTAENTRKAVEMYERNGYRLGFHTPDYFGPGRDFNIYSKDVSREKITAERPQETITEENRQQVLELAQQFYPKERFEEFAVALDLILQQKNPKAILKLHSFVLRDQERKLESFGIMFTGAAYRNVIVNAWSGVRDDEAARARMMDAIKSIAKDEDKGVIISPREGQDQTLVQDGFRVPEHGIPRVFTKHDETEFLLYTKKLK